jgi:hypothetical protein
MRTTAKTSSNVGDDLVIVQSKPRCGVPGIWVKGTLSGHRLSALVFSEHAECPEYELRDSRISKLWLQRISDGRCVANFDRGWDVRPTTTVATSIVDFLAAKLADMVYPS